MIRKKKSLKGLVYQVTKISEVITIFINFIFFVVFFSIFLLFCRFFCYSSHLHFNDTKNGNMKKIYILIFDEEKIGSR